ncbi:MAG: hypothetical protein EU536_02400 [Promethearchaeota archaeon]|nr:MAG: hypothetical protein EU536_02400 [Candidatus Lokiarchaeota archaeon]
MSIEYYFLNIGITALGRALDLLSTYYITPSLKLETNRLVSKFGWKGSIVLQIPVLILGAFFRPIAIFFLAWSIIVAASNISGAWFIKHFPGGDVKYAEFLTNSAKKASILNILLDESTPLVLYTLPSVVVWIWIASEIGNIIYLIEQETLVSYVLIITGALIFHGIVSFIRNFLYIIRLRKEKMQPKEGSGY